MNSENNRMENQLGQGWEELVAGEVLGELTEAEHKSLDAVRNTEAYSDLLNGLQSTLGGVQLALESSMESMPAELRQRIAQDAPGYLTKPQATIDLSGSSSVSAPAPAADERTTHVDVYRGENSGRTGASRSVWSAVRESVAWIACAAAILIAFGLWNPEREPVELTLRETREILQRSSETIQVPWEAAEHPFESEVSGDVVWNTEQQQGVMRFVGLPKNDPTVEQYQLWIIDPGRDDEPIDGGVFDAVEVGENGEVFVAINAKLNVVSPAAFAITVEKPGGVVVSTQERLPLIAMVN